MLYSENPESALMEAALESIENMAFSEFESFEDEFPMDPSQPYVQISLGDLGHLDMSMNGKTLEELTSIILNLNPGDLEESAMRDTLMEIINIVAGRFCHQIVGEKSEFQLGLPQIDKAMISQNGNPVICSFSMDGIPAICFRFFPKENQDWVKTESINPS